MLCREITAVCCESHAEHKSLVWTKCRDFSIKAGGTHG